MQLIKNYQELIDSIEKQRPKSPPILIAVSKGRRVEEIKQLYQAGVRDFGENRVEEFLSKKEELEDFCREDPIRWHFIGDVQSRKIKSLIGQTFLVHSIYDTKRLELFDHESFKRGVITDLLLQVNVSQEESKKGDSIQQWRDFLMARTSSYKGIRIRGLMTLAPFESDENSLNSIFLKLSMFQKELEERFPDVKELSMGMSRDWKIATACGSSYLRLGRALFEDDSREL